MNHDPRARRIEQLKDALRDLLRVLDDADADPGSVVDFDDRDIERRWEHALARARLVVGKPR